MRPIANQIAGLLRRRASGPLLALGLLLLASCGGRPGSMAPADDPARAHEANLAELRVVQIRMVAEPDQPYWPWRAAELQLARGAADEARAMLVQALGIDPDHTPSLLMLSKLHYEAGEHEQAVAMLEGAIGRGAPDADALRVALALNLESLGATEAARTALAACREDAAAREGAEAFLSLRGEDYLQARPAVEQALRTDPTSASNHNNFGIALLYDGEPGPAREAFLAALELDPQLAGALYNLAIVETFYFYDLERGRQWFTRYAALASEDPDQLGAVFGIDLAATAAGYGPDSAEGRVHAK